MSSFLLENFKNKTLQGEFQLLAFTNIAGAKIPIVIFVLLFYVLSLMGNLIIIALVCLASHLHTPMYFFLCNLSIQDLIYTSNLHPKLLSITLTGNTSIAFPPCISQIYLFIFCFDVEIFLLTSMAYDRYVAICSPLHYSLKMNRKVCMLLAIGSWISGALNSTVHSFIMSNLPFCKSRIINHFFCEVETMLKLSCKDTKDVQHFIFFECLFLGFVPFLLIMISYIYIIITILKIRTSEGRRKTFSSCSSHLTVVILLYGTGLGSYMKTETKNYPEQDKLISMTYTLLVPMLNPLVYSLRNKDVLKAMTILTGKSSKI
ncbi:olfactory receptor 1019-like [Spea bombifrons]|uniref:olfactory receptor 1019-like n=1 Tax=Spea bombifrons TaxID=233779 RepID=UPI00234A5CC1|nr:olfactory receptor 1019-like [Spea bombifrons]